MGGFSLPLRLPLAFSSLKKNDLGWWSAVGSIRRWEGVMMGRMLLLLPRVFGSEHQVFVDQNLSRQRFDLDLTLMNPTGDTTVQFA